MPSSSSTPTVQIPAPRSNRSTWDDPHYVYLCRDEVGVLLYVGCSVNVLQRMNTHRYSAAWWRHATDVQVLPRSLPRDEALALETALIQRLRPLFNRVGSVEGNHFRAQRYLERFNEGHLFKHPGWVSPPRAPKMTGRHSMPWDEWYGRWDAAGKAWRVLYRCLEEVRVEAEQERRRLLRLAHA